MNDVNGWTFLRLSFPRRDKNNEISWRDSRDEGKERDNNLIIERQELEIREIYYRLMDLASIF